MAVCELLLTLDAKKVKTKYGYKTELYKNGELYATFPDTQTQPHGNKKTIMVNCFKWKLNWIK